MNDAQATAEVTYISEFLKSDSDFGAVIKNVAEPAILCDEWGIIRAANAPALRLFAQKFGISHVFALGLRLRNNAQYLHPALANTLETKSSASLVLPTVDLMRFDAPSPDVPPNLKPNGTVKWDAWGCVGTTAIHLTPLPSGYFWVRFEATTRARTRDEVPSVAMFMRQMAALNHAVGILRTREEVIGLFVSSLEELLGDIGVVVQLMSPSSTPHNITAQPTQGFVRRFGGELKEERAPLRWLSLNDATTLSTVELYLRGSKQGCRLCLDATGNCLGLLQIELPDGPELTVEEQELLFLFAQHLSMALARHQANLPETLGSGSYSFEGATDALVMVCDLERRIRVVNHAFRHRFTRRHKTSPDLMQVQGNVRPSTETSKRPFISHDILEFVSEESVAVLQNAIGEAIASRRGQNVLVRFGLERWPYMVHLAHLGTPSVVTGFSAVCYSNPEVADILPSPKSQLPGALKARLTESQRLITLGRLADKLAHELKNPMTSILSYADYLLSKYRDSLLESRDTERLERIIADVEHMNQCIHDLITFNQADEASAEPVSLHSTLREAVNLAGPSLTEYEVVYDFSAADDQVFARPGHMHAIFSNLLKNAASSMTPEQGVITIKTYEENNLIFAEVHDQGCGIPEENMDRIFEPYFTTRQAHGGSGIGLSVVQMLADRQSAQIQVASEVGSGTCFTVVFPKAPAFDDAWA